MSRNGAGVYSLPAGSTVTNGDVSDATDINTPLADIAADLNVARPIVAGGTGAVTAAAALVNLGLTATAAEINIMDGVTASTAELNILDGVTSTAAELNILDGATLTVTELNYVDGVTSAIQTQLDAKQPLDADLTALAGLASTGMIARTGAGTVAARTLTAGTGISISNGDGVSGNPTITNTLTVEATVLLGTLATTSGTSVTLSSLVLTDYKFLKVVFRGVSTGDAASNLRIAGDECSAPLGSAANRFYGTAEIDLSDGTWSAAIGVNISTGGSGSGTMYGGNSGYTTATTSVTFSIDVDNFDAGSILVYGVK